jgi:uncharacterized paraquat-inducible protein A
MISKDIFEVLDEIKDEKVIELLQHIKRLVERDIPQKVIIHENEGAFECSNCLETGNTDSMWLFTEIGEYDYCPRCGHVLDWEDEDE